VASTGSAAAVRTRAQGGGTELVSVSSDEVQTSDGPSGFPSISADGQYVVFQSSASNLVPGDTNGQPDIFVRDRAAGTTERVSVGSGEEQGNGPSFDYYAHGQISADGRFVVFDSLASNLVPQSRSAHSNVFLRDRLSGTTRLISQAATGEEADGDSSASEISADSNYIAFVSSATNLVPGDTNGVPDAFVRNLATGDIHRVSVSSGGSQQNNGMLDDVAISAHGGNVAFTSYASNLVPGDHNAAPDIYVREANGHTRRVSVSSDETGGDKKSGFPTISTHGRYIAFQSSASNQVPHDTNQNPDIFVRDLATGTTSRVSVTSDGAQANGGGVLPSISGDGRYIAFLSESSNLTDDPVTPHFHVYVRDRVRGVTSRVSMTRSGAPAERGDSHVAISRDGRHIAFSSFATLLLVANDTNQLRDVFVRDTPGSVLTH
jgi:Tol biopolymer transport system component